MMCDTNNKNKNVLIDYCSGALNEAQAREVEQHIAICGECRRTVEAQNELWRALDQFAPPQVSVRFNAGLYARIAEEDCAPLWKRWMRRVFEPAVPVAIWKPAVSLAAVCAVLTFGLMVRIPNRAENVQQIRAEHAVDIEQVADALDDLELLTPGSAM